MPRVPRLRNFGVEEGESKGSEGAKVNTGSWNTGRKMSLGRSRNLKRPYNGF